MWMLPTLALIKQEKTVDYVVGLDDLGGKDDFTTQACSASLKRGSHLHQKHHARHMAAPAHCCRGSVHPHMRTRHADEQGECLRQPVPAGNADGYLGCAKHAPWGAVTACAELQTGLS